MFIFHVIQNFRHDDMLSKTRSSPLRRLQSRNPTLQSVHRFRHSNSLKTEHICQSRQSHTRLLEPPGTGGLKDLFPGTLGMQLRRLLLSWLSNKKDRAHTKNLIPVLEGRVLWCCVSAGPTRRDAQNPVCASLVNRISPAFLSLWNRTSQNCEPW